MADQFLPHTGVLERDWILWVELWLRAVRHPELRPTAVRLYARMREWLAEAIAEGQQSGAFRRDADPERMADRLMALGDGYGIRVLIGELDVEYARRELWAGLARRARPRGRAAAACLTRTPPQAATASCRRGRRLRRPGTRSARSLKASGRSQNTMCPASSRSSLASGIRSASRTESAGRVRMSSLPAITSVGWRMPCASSRTECPRQRRGRRLEARESGWIRGQELAGDIGVLSSGSRPRTRTAGGCRAAPALRPRRPGRSSGRTGRW